ncbi:MAG: MFS transporter, partial [Firmicutes bacterium]|nr:MFS transporter [Bacillota bacterium]
MKLNNKRTILVGLAFLSICAFWQMYDNVVPLILTNTFHLNETFSGAIMAADNILALFLLPFFGGLSDKTNTKIGKRMPYILFGTGCAVILLNVLPMIDNGYYAAPSTFKLASFVIALALLLIAMGVYRSPAVALMPDVTPKPLRSKANAIINLMGAVGGMIYLAIAAVLYPNKKVLGLEHVNYRPLFIIVSAIMFVAVGILFLTIKEPKLVEENKELEERHPEWNLAEDDGSGGEVLPPAVKKSLG